MITKKYTGSVYIGVVGPENEPGVCRDSIQGIQLRAGDRYPRWVRATKGYEARQMHLNKWYEEGEHEYILLLDHDMIFPVDTLERLRNHQLPFVSGYYLRRHYDPIAPVWLAPMRNGWPFIPFTDDPDPKVLHELGASGWGCMLMHRDVVTAVKPLLKGEPEIIEDDMDVWPYDLQKIMQALHALRDLETTRPDADNFFPAFSYHLNTLDAEIKPLRGLKTPIIGSDIRFPFFAKAAGFKLYGDASVRCGHLLNYPLHPDDYSGQPESIREALGKRVQLDVSKERVRIKKALEALR